MAPQAHVRSLESIESFRNGLILYLGKARPLLESVMADATRVKIRLENEQRLTWENEVKKRQRKLEEVQQALYSARMATLRDAVSAEQMAVHKARRSLEEAQAKLQLIKVWIRDFDGRVQPLVKVLQKLDTIFSQNLNEGVAYLTQTVQRLAEYAQITGQPFSSSPKPSDEKDAAASPPSTGESL